MGLRGFLVDSWWFSAERLRSIVTMPDLITALRAGLIASHLGEFTTPQRYSFGDGTGLVMPSFHTPTGVTVTKCLSSNEIRTPTLVGCTVWTAPHTEVTLIADATAVTALRTGAIVGLATRLCAPRESATLLLFGTGVQAADQVRAVCAVREIVRVVVIGRDESRAARFAEQIRGELAAVSVEVSTDPSKYLGLADVICCATRSREPLFAVDDLREEVHVNAIGSFLPSMRELPTESLATAHKVLVDDIDACLIEAGEVIAAVEEGVLSRSRLLALGDALHAEQFTRSGRTVFKSVGTAVQDWVVMNCLADATGLNTKVAS
jgi:ornithine cyclodeaminase